jgi:type VI secretion system protein ImpD
MKHLHEEKLIENIIIKCIERINELINTQINYIIHHEEFQKIESSWRSLYNLTDEVNKLDTTNIHMKVLNLSFSELANDIDNNKTDIESSSLFTKIYSDEFDTAGGTPYSLILADYQFHNNQIKSYNCIEILSSISYIASQSLCPLITGADSKLCDLTSWSEIKPFHDYDKTLSLNSHWNALCETIHSQFIGLVAPRVKLRPTYQTSEYAHRNFFFTENNTKHDDNLWGNSAYRYVSAIISSFYHTGWFLNINKPLDKRGAYQSNSSHVSHHEMTQRINTEFYVTEQTEEKLNQIGIITLFEKKLHSQQSFSYQPSIYKGAHNHVNYPNHNWQIQLPYLLCACRIAQTLKILMREKIGLFTHAAECESWISNWLLQYCSSENTPNIETQLKYPLSEAKVKLNKDDNKPGKYNCILHIKPHSLLEGMQTTLKLSSKINVKVENKEAA